MGVKLTGNVAGVMLNTAMMRYTLAAAFLLAVVRIVGASDYPAPAESDYTIRDFRFTSGETLPELRLHYRTWGRLRKIRREKRRTQCWSCTERLEAARNSFARDLPASFSAVANRSMPLNFSSSCRMELVTASRASRAMVYV